ncbi:ABC transporter substrate-binding protein [Nocardioides alcanivorans]|uniref:ABC transporter substrate-binding protein n=1 Tax=Nocardioides alcanivorans TaxID=2897352 RepID=UPI0028A03CB1|nr:ABC transporter substrate-binding protein [Nocardioides alcanivorans]
MGVGQRRRRTVPGPDAARGPDLRRRHPFTSATVVANIVRSQELEGSSNAGILAGTTAEEIDETHVRLRNERGVGHLPRLLSGAVGAMISDKAIADKVDLTEQEAGIGAFNLESVQPNRVVYSANEDYWDDSAAAVDTLEITYLADDAKLNAVRSGEVDITILPEKMVKPAEDAGYSIERSYGAENYSFSVNTDLKPFDDPRVREAMNIGIDRQAMCDAVLDGACQANGQLFGTGTQAYDADKELGDFAYDVERAKELVKEAGAEGSKFDLVTVAGNQAFEQLATVFQAQMKEIGLEVDVKPIAPPQVVSRFAVEKNAPVAFGAIGNAFDPSESIERYILPTGLYNPGGFSIDAINEKAAEALLETDQDARMALYREISGMAPADGFFIPLMTPETAYVIAGHVEGWENPWAPSFPSFRGVKG